MRIRGAMVLAVWIGIAVAGFGQERAEQCTSAVLSPAASATGGAVLWKNRDTDVLSNKVVYVPETPYSYLALVNHDAASGRHAWVGLNTAGFAIMNTVAYNLPDKPDELKDLEGIIMADALRTCATVEDFERYLQANQGPDLGAQANFGVIDGEGKAFIYEVHNHGFQKHDAAAAPEKYLVNTNFARSGEEGTGAGYLRFERASQLFRDLPPGPVDYRTILTRFSRDTGHPLVRQPTPDEWHAYPAEQELWIPTRHSIDRPDTSAAVVITGRTPSDKQSPATMWVIPGEPLTAIAVPLWPEAGRTPELLWKGDEAPLWQESMRIKKLIRPLPEKEKREYLLATRLDNAAGTGFLPKLRQVENEILTDTAAFLKQKHTPAELADFQDRMAAKAYAAMQAVK
jgi:hypothetical protein